MEINTGKQSKGGDNKNRSQIKEQEKSPEKELNEVEASSLPVTEFKTMALGCSRNLELQKHKKGHKYYH